jgi:type II secretory pathway predicted ATPase ExeA
MYELFFALASRPFAAAPSARCYFPATTIESARQTLLRCIQRAEGIGLVIGPAGCGKTLLCHVLAQQCTGLLDIAHLAGGAVCTRRALLQAILFELGLPYRNMEEGDLRLLLIDRLSPRGVPTSVASKTPPSSTTPVALPSPGADIQSGGLLLLVDEAHTLPLRLLEELRLITNIVRGGQPRVRLILAGNAQLEERFASHKLEAFNQRVAARCYLESFDRQQTIDYVRHQIQQVGGQPERIFTDEALEAVHSATDGIPRLVNQVCDHALILAYAGGVQQLSAAGIEEAWSDLQQLPAPRNADEGAPAVQQSGSFVEFGSLDDEEVADALPPAVPFRTISEEKPLSAREHLRQITAKLAELDDDFQPAGSIRPEVEITLPAAQNPFADAFEEEEIVIDRYTSADIDTFADRPLVRSSESRQLSALLAAAELTPQEAARPARAVAYPQLSSATTETPAMSSASPSKSIWPGGIPSDRTISAPKTEPVQPSDSAPAASTNPSATPSDSQSLLIKQFAATVWPKQSASAQESIAPQASPAAPATNNLAISLSTSMIFPSTDNDADLIVIEDAIEPPAAKQPSAKVHRQEYRRLFSQLRHG